MDENTKLFEPNDDDEDCDIVEWQDPNHPKFSDPNEKCVFYEDNIEFGWLSGCPIVVVQMVHLFGFYWCVNTVIAIGQFTLAGSFSQWYWTQRDNYVLLSKRPLGQGWFSTNFVKQLFFKITKSIIFLSIWICLEKLWFIGLWCLHNCLNSNYSSYH